MNFVTKLAFGYCALSSCVPVSAQAIYQCRHPDGQVNYTNEPTKGCRKLMLGPADLQPVETAPLRAKAGWSRVGESDKMVVYIDPSTIRRQKSTVRLWVLWDQKTAKKEPSEKPSLSRKEYWEVDCREEKLRDLSSIAYSENMGTGEIVSSSDYPSRWTWIPPDSVGQSVLKRVCGTH